MAGASATKETTLTVGGAADHSAAAAGAGSRRPLFDLSSVNLSARLVSRRDLERWNPHRGGMAMLDWVVWHSPDFTRGLGLKIVRSDEFWVEGHFPGKPMFPGVLMIETGAQLASYLYNSRFAKPKLPVFIRIEDAAFRSAVVPGDELFLLCKDVKFADKRFVSDIQGLVNGKVAFEARITGMSGAMPASE
jgi:3-hydroxyacyl-[acyl-carrier-protein] dehydratase